MSCLESDAFLLRKRTKRAKHSTSNTLNNTISANGISVFDLYIQCKVRDLVINPICHFECSIYWDVCPHNDAWKITSLEKV